MYIENSKNFDISLIKAWQDEIKPFLIKQFPITKSGLFTVNSDIEFIIKVIDSLKEQYENKQNASESIIFKDNVSTNKKNENKNERKNINENNIKDIKEEEEEIRHKSIQIEINPKRKGTETKIPDPENDQNYSEKMRENDKKDEIKNNNEEDIKIMRKQNKSKIKKFLLEFIRENISLSKRTKSMENLRPHSQTIDSKTTCESSIIEDNGNLNINNIISNNNDLNDKNNNINKKSDSNKNNNSDKKQKKLYENIFMENDTNFEKNQKIKSHQRSKSITLLREMTAFYRDDIEEGGNNIIYKMPHKIVTYIYMDLLLKKIIFEDFIKKNILIIHHFCQQCFCFVNKEVFFRKLFHCYKVYKKNTSYKILKNLIEFINILIIELFQYYQKIDLHDIYVANIKKFYNDLINDLIVSLDNFGNLNENNDDENESDYNQFRFESIDYFKNEANTNRNSNINNYYIINKKSLINMNLNIEIKDIKIFVYKEKEKEKELPQSPTIIPKNLLFRTSSPNAKSFFSTKSVYKDFKEDKKEKEEKDINIENNYKNSKKSNSPKILSSKSEEIAFPMNLEGNDNEDDLKLEIIEEKIESVEQNCEKEKKEENQNKNEKKDKNEEIVKKEKKQKLFQISKTLRKSEIIFMKKKPDIIIEEEEEQKEKSEDENNINKSLYSDKSNSEKENSSSSSNSESENDKGKENEKKQDKDLKLNKTKSNDLNEKEEENKQKIGIIKNIMKTNNISEKLLTLNEKLLDEIQNILILFEDDIEGEPSFQDIKEAKEHISFYKNLHNLKNKQRKTVVLPIQKQKRFTKSYSSIFSSLGTISSKSKIDSRDCLSKGYFCITDWKTEDIGDQLMKISKSLLNKIYPRELYRAIFLKKEKEKNSPNVIDCINKFNRLTSFIIEDILAYNYPKERAKIYEKWVLIADYCRKNKDYNDLIAIFSALNNYIITGLKLTLKEVRSRTNNLFRQISDFCTVEGNYKNIREDMNICDKNGIIFIPYLGMLMRDINFFEESGKYINENGCINIEKIENINTIFEKYFRFKSIPEKKNKIKELLFFEKLEDRTEEELEKIADQLEPDFTIEKIQKPGKRSTYIDKRFFSKYAKPNNNEDNLKFVGRKTVVGHL